MGIPGLINAIGPGERISLSKLAITHLEQTRRPIRIAVDISIWLFQVQAGRGGRNPEIRTLFYRLLKFLALPVHPLFVYDGKNKPPFKRGKAVGQRSAPIIQMSKHLIDLFKFPRHEAPGEAEAECVNLQRAGIVDAVMSNDADAMMFGSTMTVMNFSKESGSGTGSASHVTCYRMGGKADPSKAGIDRAGMVLFAMLSGGDYLPSGVPKCGSKVAAEIAKAGFGSDLLEAIGSKGTERMQQLSEWRERLQYELEENESGYFQTKHKAVRIPQNFPDQTILEYYASPAESSAEELRSLRYRLANAWDQDIDPSQIRDFAARFFDWNYRSGARKVIRLLAEPLVTYRLRLQKQPSVFPLNGPSLSNSEVPMLQKVYKTRASYSTDGLPELQLDFIPIDIVGLDLFAEEPNPPIPSQETAASGDEEEEGLDIPEEPAPSSPVKKRATKRYDPYAPEKIWIFETLARIGIPAVVEKWEKERAEKAAPKKPSTRKTGPRKKGPIDPGMKRGSILKYGTVTKERPQVSQFKQTHLFDAAVSSTPTQSSNVSGARGLERSSSTMMDTPKRDAGNIAGNLDDVIDILSSCSISPELGVKRHSMINRHRPETRRRAICSGGIEAEDLEASSAELTLVTPSPPQALPRGLKISYSNASYTDLSEPETKIVLPPSPTQGPRRQARKKPQAVSQEPREIEKLEDALSSLSLLKPGSSPGPGAHPETPADCPRFTAPKRRSPKKKTNAIPTVDHISSKQQTKTKKQTKPAVTSIEEDLAVQASSTKKTEEMHSTTEEHARRVAHQPSNPNSSNLSTLDAPPENPKPKPQLPKDAQHQNQHQHETLGHVDSITIHDDGSWTVDEITLKEKKKNNEAKASTVDPSNQHQPKPENSDTESGRKSRRGKTKKEEKRVSRVSILDLT